MSRILPDNWKNNEKVVNAIGQILLDNFGCHSQFGWQKEQECLYLHTKLGPHYRTKYHYIDIEGTVTTHDAS